jgi:hypothetical protein
METPQFTGMLDAVHHRHARRDGASKEVEP